MRRTIGLGAAAALVAAALWASAVVALAGSPHFISASASINDSGSLVASFKEAGLGTTVSTEQITLSAQASAVYACINGGSNHPKAANKETITAPISSTGSFPVRNGQTTGSLTAGPPGAGGFACPSGQSLVLSSVCYSSITLTGLAGDTATVGSLCRTLFPI